MVDSWHVDHIAQVVTGKGAHANNLGILPCLQEVSQAVLTFPPSCAAFCVFPASMTGASMATEALPPLPNWGLTRFNEFEFFPEYRFGWMVSEFAEAIASELDFICEARNAERTAKNFKNNAVVKIPLVFWEFTTSKVLTMEFCKGRKVDDLEFMIQMGINPMKVAKALVEVFAEMVFVHGFVHGDPHPGNILVSPEGPKGFRLVLLDHGIYKQLNEGFRQDYCKLWEALILLDANKIHQLSECFGVGKYSRYFPLIFTGRTIDSKSALGRGMSAEERENLKQELKSLNMEDISSFMESLPSDFITILRTDGLLRSLLRKLGAPHRVRLLAYAKYAVGGLYTTKLNPESDHMVKAVFMRLMATVRYFQLRLILEVLELPSRTDQVRHSLIKWFKQILFPVGYLFRISFP
ncbi:hypothetical protein U1Q18_039829 [Sarracenia purpurea var. burkii]